MSHELLNCREMAQADAWAVSQGVSGQHLMARAGRAVADAVVAHFSRRPVLVLCGPGNNGGDGWVAATVLHERGWPVRVACSVDPASLVGDAAWHARVWLAQPGAACRTQPLEGVALEGVEVVVDALLGAGLTRPLAAPMARVLAQVALRRLPVVAVDVPSGLEGDSGRHEGAVAARHTVTFFRKKPGHVLMPGRALCGQVEVVDIGIGEAALSGQAWENHPDLWRHHWPQPDVQAHKYQRGKVLAFGGARMVGAARLSVQAAARMGAGLTVLAVPAAVWPVYASQAWATMVEPLADGSDHALLTAWQARLASLKWSAALIGPGAAAGLPGEAPWQTLRSMVLAVLAVAGDRPVVLDADALMAFEAEPQALFSAIGTAGCPVVMTPHEGEFQRLFGASAHSKTDVTKEAARRSGAVVLHKGADTVVAAPDGRVWVNTLAPVWLATAGSGDVLTGVIAGLVGQGMPVASAVCAAAWVHGAAGLRLGPGLVAQDLPEALPGVWREWLV